MEERFFLTQFVTMANGAAHDAALHIASTFVGRNNTVAHQKRCGADMVGNHAQGVVF